MLLIIIDNISRLMELPLVKKLEGVFLFLQKKAISLGLFQSFCIFAFVIGE